MINTRKGEDINFVKEFYRNAFISMLPMIKFDFFCKKCGIHQSNLSLFLKGSEFDNRLSDSKLNELLLCITEYIEIKKVV